MRERIKVWIQTISSPLKRIETISWLLTKADSKPGITDFLVYELQLDHECLSIFEERALPQKRPV